MFRRFVTLVVLLLVPALVRAQAQPPRMGVVQGFVTTQNTVNLPGAQVVITDAADKQVGQVLTDENGHFNFVGLAPGRYKITASLASFVTTAAVVDVVAGRSSDVG